jgi:hypothetical protein
MRVGNIYAHVLHTNINTHRVIVMFFFFPNLFDEQFITRTAMQVFGYNLTGFPLFSSTVP